MCVCACMCVYVCVGVCVHAHALERHVDLLGGSCRGVGGCTLTNCKVRRSIPQHWEGLGEPLGGHALRERSKKKGILASSAASRGHPHPARNQVTPQGQLQRGLENHLSQMTGMTSEARGSG